MKTLIIAALMSIPFPETLDVMEMECKNEYSQF